LGAVNLYSRRSSELILSYQIGNRWKEQEGLNKKLQKELERLEEDLETQGDDLERLEEDLENQGDDTEANEELLKKQKELEDRIKELEKSKANSGGSNITNGTPTAESVRNTFRTAQAIDFADENGAIPPKGFYVVIGAFGVEENAINWKNASIAKGNTNTKLLYNSNLQVREVYMYYSPDREPAMLERRKQYAEYPTVWVQKLE
jgi:predicted phage gp36 major capsid-like protein